MIEQNKQIKRKLLQMSFAIAKPRIPSFNSDTANTTNIKLKGQLTSEAQNFTNKAVHSKFQSVNDS